jgi:hypothetical protein
MHRPRALAAAIVAVVAIGLLVTVASGAGTDDQKVELTAKLKGQNEVPPADPNGSGKAEVKLKLNKGKACFHIQFNGIGKATMAHIHKGAAGVNGDVRVLFFEDPAGVSSPVDDCVKAKKALLKKIAGDPKRWYVNVHTDEFPAGAIRGQLKVPGSGGGSGGGGSGGGGSGGGGGGGGPYPR